jgi:hypothetical protein
MATSPEFFGPANSDHHSTPYQLQSVEKLHAISSTRKQTIYGHLNATRDNKGAAAPLPTGGKLQSLDSKLLYIKEGHGKKEEEIAISPTRRKRVRTVPQAPPTTNRTRQSPKP